MRLGLAIAALVGSGCTCLFNPDRVALPCEPPVPPPLDIVAGDGTSLTFEWPRDPARTDITEYELCWGATSCRKVQPRACDAGLCSASVDGADAGFQYNQRVEARVTMKNLCGDVSAPSTASATPLNGSFRDTQGIELLTPCDAGMRVLVPGELTLDQTSFFTCISTAMMGDERWRDGTLNLEIRVTGDAYGGLAVRAVRDGGDSAPRNGIILTGSQAGQASMYITRRVPNGADVAAASAVPFVRNNDWEAMRVSLSGDWVSVEIGDDATKLREVMRWRDRSSAPAGRIGVALATILGGARIDLRNLRVRTSVTIPDGGATRDSWTFAGADPLHAIRPVGGGVAQVPCPPADAGCATCLPTNGCISVMNNSQATVEVPIGLDYDRPWRVKFKLLADPVAANPSVLRTTVAGPNPNGFSGFGGFGIIDAQGVNWNQDLRAFEVATDSLGPLAPGTWSAFEVAFNPSNNGYSIFRNGMLQRGGTLPMPWTQHLGALVLGGGSVRGHFADLEISQDP